MQAVPTFANNFWGEDDVGYTRLVQRMHHAKQTNEEVLSFYRERQAIEAEYARKLSALAKKGLGAHETGTLKHSLDVVRATTETMAHSHETTARQMLEQLSVPLEAFASSIRERRKTAEDTMNKLSKAKASQNAAVEKARTKYQNECHKVTGYQAQRNLLVGKELDRNNQKLDRSQLVVESLQREYQDSLRVLTETIEAWNREWRLTSDRFQDLEEERINFLKSNLWAYANALSTVCVTDDEGCENVRVALEKTEAAKDIETFVRLRGTGSKIIDAPEFTNYMSGFSRDNLKGTYKIANFARGGEEDASLDGMDTSMDALDKGSRASISASTINNHNNRASMIESANSSFDDGKLTAHSYVAPQAKHLLGSSSVGSLRPLSQESDYNTAVESSPYKSSSPSSSLYSAATSAVPSSPFKDGQTERFRPEQFDNLDTHVQPTKTVEKRRSWAVPFKKQSSPDLSKVWKTVSDDADRASLASSLRSSQDSTSRLRDSLSSRRDSLRQQTKGGPDPLLAALERLKTPPLGANDLISNRGDTARDPARQRPLSMPGISAYTDPRKQQQQQLHQSPDLTTKKSPARRQVGSGVPLDDYHNPNAAGYSYPGQIHSPPQPRAVEPEAARYHSRPRAKSSAADIRQDSLESKYKELPTRTSDGRPVVKYGRAMYDYRAAIPEEVSFRKGDVLLVVAMQEDGWWDTEVLGKRRYGLAPSNFLSNI